MNRIAFAAVKGGTGRTTLAVHLAHGLALAGQRVVLVDCDPRDGVAAAFGITPGAGLAEFLRGGALRALEVRRDLHVVTSGGAAMSSGEADAAAGRAAFDLERLLDALAAYYDVVLFDGIPASLQRRILPACDTWIVPFGADALGLAALRAGLRTLASMRTEATRIALVPTFHDLAVGFDASLDAVAATDLAAFEMLEPVRVASALRAAPAARGTVFESDPHSDAAWDCVRLVEAMRGRAA
jgi:chromosome partitioning protein